MFLLKLARVLRSLIFKNIGAPIIIFNFIFMVEYYNEYTVVQGKYFCQLCFKDEQANNSFLM